MLYRWRTGRICLGWDTYISCVDLPTELKTQLIELTCDTSLTSQLNTIPLFECWSSDRTAYPSLANKAVIYLLPFATICLCELEILAMTAIKLEAWNRLLVGKGLCVPQINDALLGCELQNKQAQISHWLNAPVTFDNWYFVKCWVYYFITPHSPDDRIHTNPILCMFIILGEFQYVLSSQCLYLWPISHKIGNHGSSPSSGWQGRIFLTGLFLVPWPG